ncbi:unnamed protein product, partial [Ascophyllum nodosum]
GEGQPGGKRAAGTVGNPATVERTSATIGRGPSGRSLTQQSSTGRLGSMSRTSGQQAPNRSTESADRRKGESVSGTSSLAQVGESTRQRSASAAAAAAAAAAAPAVSDTAPASAASEINCLGMGGEGASVLVRRRTVPVRRVEGCIREPLVADSDSGSSEGGCGGRVSGSVVERVSCPASMLKRSATTLDEAGVDSARAASSGLCLSGTGLASSGQALTKGQGVHAAQSPDHDRDRKRDDPPRWAFRTVAQEAESGCLKSGGEGGDGKDVAPTVSSPDLSPSAAPASRKQQLLTARSSKYD